MWILLLIILGTVLLTLVGTLISSHFGGNANNELITTTCSTSEFVGGCCGDYEVCDNESLLAKTDQIVYYDDEELDIYSAVVPENYSEKAVEEFREVLYSMQDDDVAGWLVSLQLRNIELPIPIREEALLIITDLRNIYQIAHAH